MKNFILLILALIVTGCGKATIDPAFQSYYDDFKKLMNDQKVIGNTAVTIEFGTPTAGDTGIAGQCQTFFLGINTIVIDRTGWEQASSDAQRVLIYHELGHCVLGRVHDTTMVVDPGGSGDFIPQSIMYPESDRAAAYYDGDADFYNSELFNYSPEPSPIP